ncbi:hypothetical protein MDA_GLEAN10023558 [Myotis davidii]|uniref:Uncharacterized protein n=1 Tax=Myotis davidii TaxID=225400 RepID=L5M0A6_MYODS|nr:hypothetical protein MDA_GLEAN10023558 [Myotis davidii]
MKSSRREGPAALCLDETVTVTVETRDAGTRAMGRGLQGGHEELAAWARGIGDGEGHGSGERAPRAVQKMESMGIWSWDPPALGGSGISDGHSAGRRATGRSRWNTVHAPE